MSVDWIDTEVMRDLYDESILLFGAGRGSEELLRWMETSRPGSRVVAIADNDPSLWGKTLQDYPIISPRKIREFAFQKIVVTSVSGARAIELQLRDMGFDGTELLQAGRYPSGYLTNFRTLKEELRAINRWTEGRRCLHVGPGGFLGLECLLYAMGADRVSSVDKFAFAIRYPEITSRMADYNRIRELIPHEIDSVDDLKKALGRFDDLLVRRGDGVYVDASKVDFRFPVDVCSMPFPRESFDLVISFAILEHVESPDLAVSEIARVLKKGGVAYHTIVTADHRSFSAVEGFTPFSFRAYSSQEWEAIAGKKFYQNRLLPLQWVRLFEETGLTAEKYTVEEHAELPDEVLSGFHPDFHLFSKEDLCDVNCRIVAVKA